MSSDIGSSAAGAWKNPKQRELKGKVVNCTYVEPFRGCMEKSQAKGIER